MLKKLKQIRQYLLDHPEKIKVKWLDRFDVWCNDWCWALKAFLCGRLLYKKEYLPDNFGSLLQIIPPRRMMLLMRLWEMPALVFEFHRTDTEETPRLKAAMIFALADTLVRSSGCTYLLTSRAGLPCIEMPPGYSMGPKRTQQDNSCPDAPAPPRFRRNEWKIARFQQRQRLPGSAKPRR